MAENSQSRKSETALREEKVVARWKERNIFGKTLSKDAPEGAFVFYDGPPFATGLPHHGSLLSSIVKDVVPRYKTMRGFRVDRQWGWDCHGLPIETLIEKKLGLKTKKDIEKIGVDTFNEAARASVMEYEHEWEKYIERIGRFVDFHHSYKTMDNSYIESVWWGLKRLHEKGLLYEGRKVLMYCPHCETPLAKAEIAMDNTYKDITEEAVTVKFELADHPGTFFLAWTTTPWTLPGNVGLAVGPDIDYVKVKTLQGNFILAEERLPEVLRDIEVDVLGRLKGKELVGQSYMPLFDVPALQSEKSYKVYAADFVSTNEGTGIVHTAVMYGEDDFALGQKEGLPMVQLLDAGAHYNEKVPAFLRGEYIKKAEKAIKEDLRNRRLLFAAEMHTHSYPHCYRCGTPLIYNAVASWFVNIQKIKERMLEENEKVTWVPAHLKEGRFKNIVESAPDWTISRNRYWASPLPVWKERGGPGVMIVESLEELKQKTKVSGNTYVVMRHGEATHMAKGIYTDDAKGEYPLTPKGQEQVRESVALIPREKPLVIVASPVLRCKETAEIVARELGVPAESIRFDDRLREMGFGEFDGKPKEKFAAFMGQEDWYHAKPQGGESLEDIKVRFGQALYEYEKTYKHSTVLVVSHKVAFDSLFAVAAGAQGGELLALAEAMTARPAEVRELPFVPLPHNAAFELDLHRPYIDEIVLLDEESREYERIPEVVDCWVESGAMPFAALHYPMEHREKFAERYPADFIAEYIAQTRTWFYYVHALGVGLWDKQAFRTVVSTGTILAADGSKMSKSKGNYTDPLVLIDQFGADALRLYLMGSVVMQGEDLRFRDEEVRQTHARVVGMFWNSYKFFELYRDHFAGAVSAKDSPHLLDRWVLSKLGECVREMTDAFERYDTPAAARILRLFIDDYSTWYLRRSRERVKKEGEDAQYALATQQYVLCEVAKLAAPLMPFIAEEIYLGAGGVKESVHLEDWPEAPSVEKPLVEKMALARAIVSKALEIRDRAGLKVRQPLAVLEARELPEDEQLHAIIAEEVNVKRIAHNPTLQEDVWLDTVLTPELREEGVLRDLLRAVQDARKKAGLNVNDRPTLLALTNEEGQEFIEQHQDELSAQANLKELRVKIDAAAEHTLGLPFPVTLRLE